MGFIDSRFSDPDHPDYECPKCGNNAYPCACMPEFVEMKQREREVKKVYRKHLRGKDRAHTASVDALTLWVGKDKKLKFARWKYDNGYMKQQILPEPEQGLYQEILTQYLSQTKAA